jgi:hypothetical protein
VLSLMTPMNPRLLRPRRRITVPGAPTITVAVESFSLEWLPPVSNGGSPIVFYRVYLDGGLVDEVYGGTAWVDSPSAGQVVEVSAVNVVGEGQKSAAVVAT